VHEVGGKKQIFMSGGGKLKQILKVVRRQPERNPEKLSHNSGSSSVQNVMNMDSINILSRVLYGPKVVMSENRLLLLFYILFIILLIIGLIFSILLMNYFDDINQEGNSINSKACNYTSFQTGFFYYTYEYYALQTGKSTASLYDGYMPGLGYPIKSVLESKSLDHYINGLNLTDDFYNSVYGSVMVPESVIDYLFNKESDNTFFFKDGDSFTQTKKPMSLSLTNNYY
jgi:hypothetical protein